MSKLGEDEGMSASGIADLVCFLLSLFQVGHFGLFRSSNDVPGMPCRQTSMEGKNDTKGGNREMGEACNLLLGRARDGPSALFTY